MNNLPKHTTVEIKRNWELFAPVGKLRKVNIDFPITSGSFFQEYFQDEVNKVYCHDERDNRWIIIPDEGGLSLPRLEDYRPDVAPEVNAEYEAALERYENYEIDVKPRREDFT